MKKSLVVSNYNSDLEWLKETYPHGFSSENTFIYDKSGEDKNYDHLGHVTRVPNYGANQYDYISFIIDQYDNLPEMSYFIKGNLFSRVWDGVFDENHYTSRERFSQMLDSEELFSGWQDKQLLVNDLRHTDTTPLEILKEGRLIQPIQWCIFGSAQNMETRHFSNHMSLLDYFFVDPPDTSLIEFVPGCIMAVPKENLLRYSKSFYQKLKNMLSYTPEPPLNPCCGEAYVLERMLWFLWSNTLIEKS